MADVFSWQRPGATPRFGADLPISEPAEMDNASGTVVTDDGARAITGGLASTTIVAQDPATGALAWSTEVGAAVFGVDAAGGVMVGALAVAGEAVVLDAVTGALRHRVAVPGEPVQVRLSADGSLAFVGLLGLDQIAVIETGTGTLRNVINAPVRTLFYTYYTRIDRSVFRYLPFEVTADGGRLVAGSFTGVTTYDAATGDIVASLPTDAVVWSISLSENGIAAAYSGDSENSAWTVSLIDIETGVAASATVSGPSFFERAAIAVSRDGTSALVSTSSQALAVTPGETPNVRSVTGGSTLSSIGGGAAAVWSGAGIRYVDLETMEVTQTVPLGEAEREIPSIMSRGGDGGSFVWSWRTEQAQGVSFHAASPEVTVFGFGQAPELDAPRTLAISPSGDRLAVALYGSGNIAVFDLVTRERIAIVPAGVDHPTGIGFVTETELLVAGGASFSDGATVHLDLASGEVLQVLRQSGTPFQSVFARPDVNRFYVFHSSDRQLDAYERIEGALVPVGSYDSGGGTTVSILSWTPNYVQVSPTGRYSAGQDPSTGDIVIVDLQSGVRTTLPTIGETTLVAFSPDDKWVAFSSLGGVFHSVSLTGTPTLATAVQVPYNSFGIAYDAQAEEYVLGVLLGPDLRLLNVNPETGAVTSERPLPPDHRPLALSWSEATGLVVTALDADGAGVLLTDDGRTTFVGGDMGETVLDVVRGEAIVAGTEVDRLVAAEGVPVSVGVRPPTPTLALTLLGTPTSGTVRVRLSGSARADARIEAVDVLGRVVAELRYGPFSGGTDEIEWAAPAPGTYVLRIVGTGVSARATVVR